MVIQAILSETLSARFPGTDFGPYFAFIESLPVLEPGNKHHILPKKEFPEYAKNPDNLIRVPPANHLRAHYWLAVCAPNYESFQRVFFFMTNFRKYASQVNTDELERYAEVYEKGRTKQVAISRQQGLKNAKNGHLAKIGIRGGHVSGPINGRKNVENRHMARIRTPENMVKARIAAGKQAVESGQIQILGLAQGRKNTESGLLDSIRTSESCAKGGRIGGPIGGRKAVESGQLGTICTKGATASNHIRWHVNRGISNPNCKLCGEADNGID